MFVLLTGHCFLAFGGGSSGGCSGTVSSFVSGMSDTGKRGQGNNSSEGQSFNHFNFP